MGILRALWDRQASYTDSRLILHIPDFSLVQSLRACPTSFSTKVTEWLHETVRMLLSSSTSLIHTSPTPVLKGSYTSGDLGMHLAHASVHRPFSSIVHLSGAGARTWPGHWMEDSSWRHPLPALAPEPFSASAWLTHFNRTGTSGSSWIDQILSKGLLQSLHRT